MTARSKRSSSDSPIWRAASFWDEVESCVEAADPLDLYEFATADRWPIDASESFRDGLHRELSALVRRRYLN